MNQPKVLSRSTARYEDDYYAWSAEQAARLRVRHARDVDWDNVAEEIEGLGRSQKLEIESRLNILLVHLLKWRFQPEKRKIGWRATIAEQRRRIAREIKASPSLKQYPAEVLAEEYEAARLTAAGETDLPEATFPAEAPFSVAQVLDPNYLP